MNLPVHYHCFHADRSPNMAEPICHWNVEDTIIVSSVLDHVTCDACIRNVIWMITARIRLPNPPDLTHYRLP